MNQLAPLAATAKAVGANEAERGDIAAAAVVAVAVEVPDTGQIDLQRSVDPNPFGGDRRVPI